MDNIKNIVLGAAVVLAVVFGVMFLSRTPTVQNLPSPLGSASSPSVNGGCFDVNGVTKCYARKALAVATTTPCVFASPNATSTAFSSLKVNVSSTTATIWTVAKAANATFATTTIIGSQFSLASGKQGTMIASSSPLTDAAGASIDNVAVFAPNTTLVWSVQGTQLSSDFLKGTCQVEWTVL